MIQIPAHPGELLSEEMMPGYGIKAPALAKRLGVTRSRLQRLREKKAPVNADMALRSARVFGTTHEFWINLLTQRDLAMAKAQSRDISMFEPLPKDAP